MAHEWLRRLLLYIVCCFRCGVPTLTHPCSRRTSASRRAARRFSVPRAFSRLLTRDDRRRTHRDLHSRT